MAKIILDLCGGTGGWSAPYKAAGYDVRIIDPFSNGEDVRLMKAPDYEVHGILAAPPCTVFSGAGNRWVRSDEEMLEGLSVMDACLRLVVVCKPQWWALENPKGKMRHYLGEPLFMFDPCDFGDPYTKKTLLWGDFTKPIRERVEPIQGSITNKKYGGSGGEKAQRIRSITPQGFAKAFFEANR